MCPNGNVAVQVEAIGMRLVWACRDNPGSVGIATEAQDAATDAAAEWGTALDRCSDDTDRPRLARPGALKCGDGERMQ